MKNFAVIGVGGYIAPRHLQAIKEVDGKLLAAIDPNDSVGVLDKYFPFVPFFKEIERFDRHLEKLKRRSDEERAHYISICSPNFLHDAHVRLALRLNADAICEKPLVISPWNMDALADLEAETGRRIYTILQLRLLPSLIALKKQIQDQVHRTRAQVVLKYVTPRGPWYHASWKGDLAKSGGITMNIGIHFFDLMTWLFGAPLRIEKYVDQPEKASGYVELEWASLKWFLSVDRKDMPEQAVREGKPAFRSITVDGQEIEFSTGFTELHTQIYKQILAGDGFGLSEAKQAIQLVHDIRNMTLTRGNI